MIGRLYMRNVGPFRGEHSVELGPGAHALLARREGRPRHSNGAGKSMLLEAVRFAITGKWPRNRGDADGWIARGEAEGCVALFLEDGAAVERRKRRGKAREARAKTPGTGWAEAFGDAATDAFVRHLGLACEGEVGETFYVGQKAADAFMSADPSDRLSIVSGWLGIASAERAVAAASGDLDMVGREAERAVILRDRLREETKTPDGERPVAELRAALAEADAKLQGLKDRRLVLERAVAAERTLGEWRARERAGREAAEAHAAMSPPGEADLAAAEEARERLGAARQAADADLEAKQRVAAGEFDGACPVAGIACPARDTINADRVAARAALKEARRRAEAARESHAAARELLAALRSRADAAARKGAEVERLRREHKEGRPDREKARAALAAGREVAGEAAPAEALFRALEEQRTAEAACLELRVAIGVAERGEAARAASGAKLADAEAEAARLLARQALLARARACVQAAQRRVAERALEDIERGANEALAAAGVDLRLAARWEREGKDHARQCEECGAAFPASARVRECGRCGAPRGRLVVRRLDLVATASSGGLDDLAGAAWQHAAGAWLLRARQSPWATAILDEPTAHMDHPTRQGLARYLLSTVRLGQYRQLVLCSHSPEILEAMPRRIVVVADGRGNSRVEVEG